MLSMSTKEMLAVSFSPPNVCFHLSLPHCLCSALFGWSASLRDMMSGQMQGAPVDLRTKAASELIGSRPPSALMWKHLDEPPDTHYVSAVKKHISAALDDIKEQHLQSSFSLFQTAVTLPQQSEEAGSRAL